MSRPILLVTGGGRGIGAAVARLAGQRGYDVCVSYLKDKTSAEGVADDVRASGGRAIAVQGNVASESDIVRLFETADAELGVIGALVNNAAEMGGFGRLEDVSAETVRTVMGINVIAPILCAREAVRRMSTASGGAGGAIVNISSTAAERGSPNDWVHYAASKGALNTFTRGLALEVAGEGIRVNAVAPGLTDTENHAMYGKPDRVAEWQDRLPLRRAAEPAEIASVVMWLLSDEAAYVTGSVYPIAGGA
jgi:NAD(P)-dependent dehydrogenase (short-subunit alcohol dehydrogenase family)